MPDIRTPLVNNEFYHLFNRGISRQPTFLSKWDFEQALLTLSYYRFQNIPVKLSRFKELAKNKKEEIFSNLNFRKKQLVDIVCFVLMPNHFHFILKQNIDNGISKFISQVTNSYTRYFNTKHQRAGPLFQGIFKSVHIESNEQLIHLSRYIHLNPLVSYVVKEKDFLPYPWSSLPDYLIGQSSLVDIVSVLSHFLTPQKYLKFVLDQADYAKKLEKIKHLILEG